MWREKADRKVGAAELVGELREVEEGEGRGQTA